MTFEVIDPRTGRPPIFDGNHIFREKWFKESHLIYCDIDTFALTEDGTLILLDDCGNAAYPPPGRFIIKTHEKKYGHYISEGDGYADGTLVFDEWYCSECGCHFEDWDEKPTYKFCPNCGADMRGEENERVY